MKKENIDGSVVYDNVLEYQGRSWSVVQRTGGSVSVYTMMHGVCGVAIDDCAPVVWAKDTADALAEQFRLMREVADLALGAIERTKAAIEAERDKQ